MSVRSAMPWPLRWAVAAIMLGFCAAIALWAFEFGRDIAGLENGGQGEMQQLRAQVEALKVELAAAHEQRDQAQSIANTAGTLVAAEKESVQAGLQLLQGVAGALAWAMSGSGPSLFALFADRTAAAAAQQQLQSSLEENGFESWVCSFLPPRPPHG
jgi:hypothetical protein